MKSVSLYFVRIKRTESLGGLCEYCNRIIFQFPIWNE